MTRRSGSTLLELLVTLAVMAVVMSVVSLALRAYAAPPADESALAAAARREALTLRRPVTVEILREGARYALTAMPDGSVVADTALHYNRLSGARVDAR